jgi:hypothetical protein
MIRKKALVYDRETTQRSKDGLLEPLRLRDIVFSIAVPAQASLNLLNVERNKMKRLIRDNVAIAYEDFGSGSQPFLFVRGWACNHEFLAPQIECFSRFHRVIAADLCGHGSSDAPQRQYTVAEFADDLAWLKRVNSSPFRTLLGQTTCRTARPSPWRLDTRCSFAQRSRLRWRQRSRVCRATKGIEGLAAGWKTT